MTIRTGNGDLKASLLIGVDDSTLIGLPPQVVRGDIGDLRRPDAVAVSEDGFRKVWRNQPLSLGNIAEWNDRRAADSTPEEVARRIVERTRLQAMSAKDFRWKAIMHVVQNTGIPISIVAVVGLMFNQAIGTSNVRLLGMVFLQATVVGFVGFSLGLFGATMFFETAGKSPTFQGFFLPWYVAAGSGTVAACIIVLAASFAMQRVLFADPAIVFCE